MKSRHTFSFYLAIVSTVLAVLFLAVIIAIWTAQIEKQTEEEKLRQVLQKVVHDKGEAGLFAMAGIPVSNIFYGDEGLSLFQGESGSWNYSADEQQNIAVYNAVKDSVVEIFSASDLSSSSTGTGVIISSDGYIITNKHVLGGGSDFTVVFSDRTSADATLVGEDSITDIAVVKVTKPKNDHKLIPVSFALDGELCVGQKALAIGNPYGYESSLSVGVISGLDRIVSTSSGAILPTMIQTDAAINPGNSGGPLLNGHGQMIGLNTSIYTTTGSSQGISFAIPSSTVLSVATDIIRTGKVSRGWLDVLLVELNPQIVEYAALPVSEGILVSQVVPSGNADKAGIKGGSQKTAYGKSIIYLGGDIITSVGDKDVATCQDLFAALFHTKAGDKVDVTVIRDGKSVVLKNVVLVEQTIENSRWIIR
jgi:Trypsin-like serine proteases, typically periplasmic, contain C-terminal PDZ domain